MPLKLSNFWKDSRSPQFPAEPISAPQIISTEERRSVDDTLSVADLSPISDNVSLVCESADGESADGESIGGASAFVSEIDDLRCQIAEMNLTRAEVDVAALVKIKLPPLPSSALRVAELTREPNISTRTIADAIGYDPILVARLLRAANSSFYARERRITALHAAVAALGFRTINQLVLSYAASSLFNEAGSGPPSLYERLIWRHSVAVGLAAREISHAVGKPGSEEAFLCGLLHDIGKIIMLRHDPQLHAQMESVTDGRLARHCEAEIYGYTHAQISALVAHQWGLAVEISDAILHHHEPENSVAAPSLAEVVRAADKLANANGFGVCDEAGDPVAEPSIIALGLTAERLSDIWERTEESMTEMLHLLTK